MRQPQSFVHPGAGHDGGRIVFAGTPAALVAARSTLSGEHLAAYVGAWPDPIAAVSREEASKTGSSSCNCVEHAQLASLVALGVIGLMSANMLRAFQVGKARTSHEGPWSWMRPSPVAVAQVSWPACHLTKASASAVI
jgi:hypothetical protein